MTPRKWPYNRNDISTIEREELGLNACRKKRKSCGKIRKERKGWEKENEGGRQLRKEEIERKKDREATGTKVLQKISEGLKRTIKGTRVDG